MNTRIKNNGMQQSTASGSSDGYTRKKVVLQVLVLVFVMGCWMTNTVSLLRSSSHISTTSKYDLAFGQPVLVDNKILSGPSTSTVVTEEEEEATRTLLIKKIDCKHHYAEDDPNKGMEEDPKKFIKKTDPNFWISLHNQNFDRVRWGPIMKQGNYYETGITEQFRDILQHAEPKGFVVDVGMNIGWFTIYSRAMGHNVLGFDPNPIMHSRVCNSLKLNHWWDGSSDNSGTSSGVTTFAYGLGDQVGNLNLTMGRNPGGSSFHKENIHKFRASINVPVTTLDLVATQMGWFQQQQQQPNDVAAIIHLLKIDTEGYEPFIIRGGSKLLFSGLVQNILVESKPRTSGSPDKEVLEWFTMLWKAGFEVKSITNGGGRKAKNADENTKNLNDSLRNGKLEGSESLAHFAKVGCNMWWTKRTSAPVPATNA